MLKVSSLSVISTSVLFADGMVIKALHLNSFKQSIFIIRIRRKFLQAHGLANFRLAEGASGGSYDRLTRKRELANTRCKPVYKIEKSWYKGNHPLK